VAGQQGALLAAVATVCAGGPAGGSALTATPAAPPISGAAATLATAASFFLTCRSSIITASIVSASRARALRPIGYTTGPNGYTWCSWVHPTGLPADTVEA
jgi:hypothetical protein